MSDLVIRKSADNSDSPENTSPDILIFEQYYSSTESYSENYDVTAENAVIQNNWIYVYVRVKNKSLNTINNVYVTLANHNDKNGDNYEKGIFQTIDGKTYTHIDTIEPEKWVITEEPFIVDFKELSLKRLYARACSGEMEYPCGDNSEAEACIECKAYDVETYKGVEGFDAIANMQSGERKCNIKLTVEGTTEDAVVELGNVELGSKRAKISTGQVFSYLCTVPANYMGYLYYSVAEQNFNGADELSVIMEYEWEE